MARSAGGAYSEGPQPAPDELPPGVSDELDGHVLRDAADPAAADAQRQPAGAAGDPPHGAGLRGPGAGDPGESGRESLFSGGTGADGRGAWRASSAAGRAGYYP